MVVKTRIEMWARVKRYALISTMAIADSEINVNSNTSVEHAVDMGMALIIAGGPRQLPLTKRKKGRELGVVVPHHHRHLAKGWFK